MTQFNPKILNFARKDRIGFHRKETHLSRGAWVVRKIVSCSLLNEFYFLGLGFARRDRIIT
jgi:hypothetical protein